MKTIKGLDEKPQPMGDNVPATVMEQIPTYRKMFQSAVGSALSKSGDEAIELFEIGLKIKRAKADIELEDAEFTKLKDKCDGNQAQWSSHFHAQVALKLRSAEKAVTELKEV